MNHKSISEKEWYEVEVDGSIITVFEDSAAGRSEMKRLHGLLGVTVRKATPESLIKHRAKTIIPKTVLDRWLQAAWDHEALIKRRQPWR